MFPVLPGLFGNNGLPRSGKMSLSFFPYELELKHTFTIGIDTPDVVREKDREKALDEIFCLKEHGVVLVELPPPSSRRWRISRTLTAIS